MKLYIKQKVFSWGAKFRIYDEYENDKYSVEGEVFTFGKKLHLYGLNGNELASYTQQIRSKGEYDVDFKAFDNEKIETYKAEVKRRWGDTEAYREYETKSADYSEEKQHVLTRDMMNIFKEFGSLTDKSLADAGVQELVKKLQNFITANYYTCTKDILAGLGQMYAAGGKGAAAFAAKAIAEYCR